MTTKNIGAPQEPGNLTRYLPPTVLIFLVLAVLTTLASNTRAAVFYLQEVGSPRSLGTAGVANPTSTGADAVWSNPAGMAFVDRDQMLAGVQAVLPNVKFDPDVASAGGDDGGNAGILTAVPSLFYVHKYSPELSCGVSLAGIMGGGVDYGDDFAGRYSTIKAQLGAFGFSPACAYKAGDQLSFGVGVSAIYTLYEQEIAISPATQSTLDGGDGLLKIEDADDIGYQPYFSINHKLADNLLLGVVYRTEMDVKLSGNVEAKNIAQATGSEKVQIDWKNPQWLEAGLEYRYTGRDTLYVTTGWQDWSAFSENRLAFSGDLLNRVTKLDRNFRDTWHLGVAYTRQRGNMDFYSLGFSYESSPVKDRDRTFDLPVDEIFKLSGGYFWERDEKLSLSPGGTLYLMGDAPVDQTSQELRTKGDFSSNAVLFLGGTLRYVF